MAAAGNDVDDELGVLPIAELVEIHVDRAAADLAEIFVVAADMELALDIAHRRRAVAAAPGLMKHQGTMLGLQLIDQLKRRVSSKHPFDHQILAMPGLDAADGVRVAHAIAQAPLA